MSIIEQALAHPDKPATIMTESGNITQFADIVHDAERLASVLRRRLNAGDRIGLLCVNEPDYLVAAWGARRAGLRFVPVNWHLTAEEAVYIITNSDAKAIIASAQLADLGGKITAAAPNLSIRLSIGGTIEGFTPLREAIGETSERLADTTDGVYMFYSSGTTGRPKGILRPLPTAPFGSATSMEKLISTFYDINQSSVYLCPAPLYHGAPMGWSLGAQGLGATVVLMEKFDAEAALRAIESYRVTHMQCVPIHFIRMLQLSDEARAKYDLSSLKRVIHAAAPCPPEVKRAMIRWLGPIVDEYYSATEGAGFTCVDSNTWLERPGTVGKSVMGVPHILDELGGELAAGQVGNIYFENVDPFVYHNDETKTAEFFNDRGWGCNGDIGWLDEDGFLYLADRKSHMIISGGVNIYPQEVENHLLGHPHVADVAVIGVPNAEYGEEVKAVVELRPGSPPGSDALAEEMIIYCRSAVAGYKCPRTIDFVDSLPRLPNGKLMKRDIRKVYWGDRQVKI